jgi:hypothetical protein
LGPLSAEFFFHLLYDGNDQFCGDFDPVNQRQFWHVLFHEHPHTIAPGFHPMTA